MSVFENKTCVVTGAASGIGEALTRELARKGAFVVMVDVDEPRLRTVAAEISRAGGSVRVDVVDIADREAVAKLAAEVRNERGAVHQVYNNAGVAFVGDFLDMTYAEIERIISINLWGCVIGTKEFLPYLVESGDGHIVNVSSMFGLGSVPGQSAYCAAKAGVRGFSESVRQELAVKGLPVALTVVHPGGIATGAVRNMRTTEGTDLARIRQLYDQMPTKTPEYAAKKILRAVDRKAPRVLIGPDAKVLDLLVRVVGPRYQGLITSMMKRVSM